MYNHNNNNLTASQPPQLDIYAILATDPTTPTTLDTDALVMNIFDASYSALSSNTAIQSPAIYNHHHPLSVNSTSNNSIESNNFPTPNSTSFSTPNNNELNFNQQQSADLINFDITSQQQQQSIYTPNNNSFLSSAGGGYPSQQEDPIPFNFANRRHSVAVISGGIADFNLRNLAQQPTILSRGSSPFGNSANNGAPFHPYPQPSQPSYPSPLSLHNNRHRQLTAVIEGQPTHRSSMPNIFLSEESRRQLNDNIQKRQNSFSARNTPNSTPPPVSIDFNPMPWSSSTNTTNNDTVIGRKRFYSQQFDSFPSPPKHQPILPFQQQQPPPCPLPMSGIMSRRTSVATPNDIYTWNRMVNNPNDRIIVLREEQHQRKIHAPSATSKKRIVLEQETAEAEEEDYPMITQVDLEAAKKDPNAIPRRQKLRYTGDAYTPKWVRYTGQLKEGYCDTCKPGGKWLQLKNSAFWYHKQFFHGISSVSGKPFHAPLVEQRAAGDVLEGLCHQCKQFVPICNSKRKNSVLWYRHAHKCHVYDKPKAKGGKRASISISSSNNNKFQLNDQMQKIC